MLELRIFCLRIQLKMKDQVKTKKRVEDHGEVFTSHREVTAMLDLVKQETERIDSRFLEPACGDGNFLAEILKRKLEVVDQRYSKSQLEWERYSIVAVSSIYGIDILQDNVRECKKRLFNIYDSKYSSLFKGGCQEECKTSVQFLLDRNILWGDALTLKTPDEKPEYIVFSEWSAVNGSMIKRRDFTFHGLLEHERTRELPLFSDVGEDVFIPEPVKEYPLIHFLKLSDATNN
jgi:hypothetical protein